MCAARGAPSHRRKGSKVFSQRRKECETFFRSEGKTIVSFAKTNAPLHRPAFFEPRREQWRRRVCGKGVQDPCAALRELLQRASPILGQLESLFRDVVVRSLDAVIFFDIAFWSDEIQVPLVVLWLIAGALFFTLRFQFVNLPCSEPLD